MLAVHGLRAAIHLEEGSGISRNNHSRPRPRQSARALSHPTPTCSTAMTAAWNKTGSLDGSARSRAMPIPQATGGACRDLAHEQ